MNDRKGARLACGDAAPPARTSQASTVEQGPKSVRVSRLPGSGRWQGFEAQVLRKGGHINCGVANPLRLTTAG